jgi:hypothetical protein
VYSVLNKGKFRIEYVYIIITNSIQFDIYYSKVTGPRLNMLMLYIILIIINYFLLILNLFEVF